MKRNKTKCPHCKGGVIKEYQYLEGGIVRNKYVINCPYCDGSGYIDEPENEMSTDGQPRRCTKCHRIFVAKDGYCVCGSSDSMPIETLDCWDEIVQYVLGHPWQKIERADQTKGFKRYLKEILLD